MKKVSEYRQWMDWCFFYLEMFWLDFHGDYKIENSWRNTKESVSNNLYSFPTS